MHVNYNPEFQERELHFVNDLGLIEYRMSCLSLIDPEEEESPWDAERLHTDKKLEWGVALPSWPHVPLEERDWMHLQPSWY